MRQRRFHREHQAYLETPLTPDETSEAWEQIESHLDSAMADLPRKDHDALALRYLQGRSFKEVSGALGTTEAGAKMRVNRALEKLRLFFSKRGVTLSAVTIGAAMANHSVQAAPAGLAAAATAAAVTGTTLTVSTSTLIHKTLQYMAWTKIKTAGAIGAVAILTLGTATVITQRSIASPPKEQKAPAPYATPEATYQSLVVALKEADLEKFAEACTPQKADQFRLRHMGKSKTDLEQESSRQAKAFSKAKVLGKKTVSADEVHLQLEVPKEADGTQGLGGKITLVMKKIGTNWKYHGDIRE